jgi:hypothetical protein
MPDPTNPCVFPQEQLHAAYGDKEKPASPSRSLRSRGTVALFSSAIGEDDDGKKPKPPPFPGQKLPAKRQFIEQALLTELPSLLPTQQRPQLPPPTMPPVAGAVTTMPAWRPLT